MLTGNNLFKQYFDFDTQSKNVRAYFSSFQKLDQCVLVFGGYSRTRAICHILMRYRIDYTTNGHK